jgi:hypothetical protein
MAADTSIKISGRIANLVEGTRFFDCEITNTPAPNDSEQIQLANGDNTLVRPGNAIGCIIIPDPTSTVLKKIKGDTGDDGIYIDTVNPTLLPITTNQGHFIIWTNGADTGKYTEVVWF